MSEELIAFILATVVGVLPNIVLKWLDTRKSREEREKTSMESADMAQEMLKETLEQMRIQNEYLNNRITMKSSELDLVRQKLNKHERILEAVMRYQDCLPDDIRSAINTIREVDEKE